MNKESSRSYWPFCGDFWFSSLLPTFLSHYNCYISTYHGPNDVIMYLML